MNGDDIDDFLCILLLLKLKKCIKSKNEVLTKIKNILLLEQKCEKSIIQRYQNNTKSNRISNCKYEDDCMNFENFSDESEFDNLNLTKGVNVYNKSDLMPCEVKAPLRQPINESDTNSTTRNRKNEMCELCGKIVRRSNFEFHMNSHFNRKPFKCDVNNCKMSCSSPSALFSHKKLHSAIKEFSCDLCSAKFNLKGCLLKHKTTHLEPRLKCDMCDSMFKSKFRLNFHIKNIHGEFENIECTIPSCGRNFKNSHYLRKHLRKFHNIKVRSRVSKFNM
ncbi:zinc finger protein 722-like [Condylostylus longicornis]|uniref:zinc finger protein 722-like n=1 Tax=Condylostylus longicornis TaxID=2530218 RepID=UPI00244E2156|nr:zinc finger protein 722-like [Condylostylus longicornis]